jgi:hypothetical protein
LGFAILGNFLLAIAAATVPSGPLLHDDDPVVEPVTRQRPQSDVFVFLSAPADLGTLLARMTQPDFVLVEWDRFQHLLEQANGKGLPKQAGANVATVQTVVVDADLGDEDATIKLRLEIESTKQGVTEVALPLDGAVITDAIEGSSPLRLWNDAERGWRLELDGKGSHHVLISLRVPIRVVRGRRHFEVRLPEAASNRLEVRSTRAIFGVRMSGSQGSSLEVRPDGEHFFASARFSPRSRLELTWSTEPTGTATQAAFLTALGEISLEVEPGQLMAEASYELKIAGGPIDFLTLRVGQGWEKLGVELDGQPIQAAVVPGESGGSRLKVPVNLRSEVVRRLVLRTRRLIPIETATTLTFQGFEIEEAQTQSGLIAILQAGESGVRVETRRGVRKIDHRSELPASLRVRPQILMGFQYVDQPFDLDLTFMPAIPWEHIEARTSIMVEAAQIILDSWFDYRIQPGRPSRVEIEIPHGLSLELIGPPEVVESFDLVADEGNRQLALVVMREDAASEGNFSLHAKSRIGGWNEGRFSIGMMRPVGTPTVSGWLALTAVPDVDLRPVLPTGSQVVDVSEAPARAWPGEGLSLMRNQQITWVRTRGMPESLVLDLTRRPPEVRASSVVQLTVNRESIRFEQTIDFDCKQGRVADFDLVLPAALGESWECDGVEIARRESLDADSAGNNRVRFFLTHPIVSNARIQVRGRLALPEGKGTNGVRALQIPEIGTSLAQGSLTHIEVAAGPGIELVPDDAAWRPWNLGENSSLSLQHETRRGLVLEKGTERLGPAKIGVRIAEPVPLATLIVPRCLIKTSVSADGSTHTLAEYFVQKHQGELRLSLPKNAKLLALKQGERSIAGVKKLEDGRADLYVSLPLERAPEPIVRVEYSVPRRQSSHAWGPELPRDAVMGTTYWRIVLPGSQALLLGPSGWDQVEPRQVWAAIGFRNEPTTTDAELAAWLAGDSRSAERVGELASARGLLFSSTGGRTPMGSLIVSRAWLSAICSTVALILGLVFSALSHKKQTMTLMVLALVFVATTSWLPFATLQILQSSAPGIALTLIAWLVRWILERSRSGSVHTTAARRAESSATHKQQPQQAGQDVVSDDSTIVRPRAELSKEAELLASSTVTKSHPTAKSD